MSDNKLEVDSHINPYKLTLLHYVYKEQSLKLD